MAKGEHGRAAREHEGARGSKGRARGSIEGAGGAQREHIAEIGLSAGAMRRYRIFKTQGYYIYIYIYIRTDLLLESCWFCLGRKRWLVQVLHASLRPAPGCNLIGNGFKGFLIIFQNAYNLSGKVKSPINGRSKSMRDVYMLTKVQKLSSPSQCLPKSRHPGTTIGRSLYLTRT